MINKRNILSIFCLVFTLAIFSSCDNSGTKPPASNYFMKAKFDGQLKTFAGFVTGQRSMDSGKIVLLELSATQNNNLTLPKFNIVIKNSNGNIKVGVFSEVSYDIESQYTADTSIGYNNFNPTIKDYVVNITSLTTTEIKGTFSGTLNKDTQNIVLTEGEFCVPFKD